jgi:hypothetical protein
MIEATQSRASTGPLSWNRNLSRSLMTQRLPSNLRSNARRPSVGEAANVLGAVERLENPQAKDERRIDGRHQGSDMTGPNDET